MNDKLKTFLATSNIKNLQASQTRHILIFIVLIIILLPACQSQDTHGWISILNVSDDQTRYVTARPVSKMTNLVIYEIGEQDLYFWNSEDFSKISLPSVQYGIDRICRTENNLWVQTLDGQVFHYDHDNGNWAEQSTLPGRSDCEYQTDGKVIFSGMDWFGFYQDGNWVRGVLPQNVYVADMVLDLSEQLWLITKEGDIYSYNNGVWSFYGSSSIKDAHKLLVANDNSFYISQASKLYYWPFGSQEKLPKNLMDFSDEKGFVTEIVTAFAVDKYGQVLIESDKSLWMGIGGEILSIPIPDQIEKIFSAAYNPTDDLIYITSNEGVFMKESQPMEGAKK